jgi:hypothetical protein
VAVWFVGGIAVVRSPGKTFMSRPSALFAVVPTIIYVKMITPDQPLRRAPFGRPRSNSISLLAYIMAGMLGVMISLFGAFIGERSDGDQRPRRRSAVVQ